MMGNDDNVDDYNDNDNDDDYDDDDNDDDHDDNVQAACCVGDPTCVDCLTGLLPGLNNERRGSQGDDDC